MVEAELFSAALSLQKPWHVSELDFSANKKSYSLEFQRRKSKNIPPIT